MGSAKESRSLWHIGATCAIPAMKLSKKALKTLHKKVDRNSKKRTFDFRHSEYNLPNCFAEKSDKLLEKKCCTKLIQFSNGQLLDLVVKLKIGWLIVHSAYQSVHQHCIIRKRRQKPRRKPETVWRAIVSASNRKKRLALLNFPFDAANQLCPINL